MRRASIYGALRKLVLQLLQKRLLNLSHPPPLSGHLAQLHMYETMQRDYYWPKMASNVYRAVTSCHSCAKNGIKLKHKRHLQLLRTSAPYKFVALDILDSLSKATKGNHHVVIVTDRYFNLTQALPTARVTKTALAWIFFDAWKVHMECRHILLLKMVQCLCANYLAMFVSIRHKTPQQRLRTTHRLTDR